MKNLRFPRTRFESTTLKARCNLAPIETKEIIQIDCIRGSLYDSDQYKESISLYLHYLKETQNNQFSDSLGLHRTIQQRIAFNYQFLGEKHKVLGIKSPEEEKEKHWLECIDAYQKAMIWFQVTDETIRFYTYSMFREQLSCANEAVDKRLKVEGLDNEIACWLTNRIITLRPATANTRRLISLDRSIPDGIQKIVEEVVEDTMRGYLRGYPYLKPLKDETEITLESLTDTTSQELDTTTTL